MVMSMISFIELSDLWLHCLLAASFTCGWVGAIVLDAYVSPVSFSHYLYQFVAFLSFLLA